MEETEEILIREVGIGTTKMTNLEFNIIIREAINKVNRRPEDGNLGPRFLNTIVKHYPSLNPYLCDSRVFCDLIRNDNVPAYVEELRRLNVNQ